MSSEYYIALKNFPVNPAKLILKYLLITVYCVYRLFISEPLQ